MTSSRSFAGGGGSSTPPTTSMLGLVAATGSLLNSSTGSLSLSSGTLIFVLVRPGAVTITNLGCLVATAGSGFSGVNGMALYSEAGARLDTTADMTTAFGSGGYKEAALTAPYAAAANTNYYLAVLTHATGAPAIAGMVTSPALAPVKGHYPSVYLTSQATFPASFTPSAATQNNAMYWLAAS